MRASAPSRKQNKRVRQVKKISTIKIGSQCCKRACFYWAICVSGEEKAQNKLKTLYELYESEAVSELLQIT